MMHLRRARLRPLIAPICLCLFSLPALAVDLAWPEGAELVLNTPPSPGSHNIAIGPIADGALEIDPAEGAVSEQVWHIPGDLSDPALMLGLMRDQLDALGFEIIFTCADRSCGGFDFRHALPIAAGPEMHVDLGNFRYLAARSRDADSVTRLALTLSHGGRRGYAHLAIITPPAALPVPVTSSSRLPGADLPPPDMIDMLLTNGYAVLDDLIFGTGASALSGAEYESLMALGRFLSENPTRRVVLVGHTDAEGTLEANITLSRARATAVRQVLIDRFNLALGQIEAEGIGYLAPRASNATEDGRQANRRVEVVLADP